MTSRVPFKMQRHTYSYDQWKMKPDCTMQKFNIESFVCSTFGVILESGSIEWVGMSQDSVSEMSLLVQLLGGGKGIDIH